MIRYFLLLFLVLAALSFVVYQVFSFGLFLKSGNGQTKKDLEDLKDLIQPLVSTLVPLSQEELELLSLNQSNRSVSKGMSSVVAGTFDSIYHEPLLAYAYKDFMGSDKALMVAMTSKDTWVYDISRGRTKVYLNDTPVGIITNDGYLRGIESKRELAFIQMDHSVSSHPVYVANKEIGHVYNPKMLGDVNPRAFMIHKSLEEDELDLFLSLSLLSLVEESL